MEAQYIVYDPEEHEREKEKVLSQQTKEQDEEEYENQCSIISFLRLDEQNKKQCGLRSGTADEKHLWVMPGVNLKGKCPNPACIGKNGCWYNLGFGEFIINVEVTKGKCRKCESKIKSKTVLTLGFTRATVQFQGVIEDSEENQTLFEQRYEELQGKFIYFQGNSDANLANWRYLKVVCRQV